MFYETMKHQVWGDVEGQQETVSCKKAIANSIFSLNCYKEIKERIIKGKIS